MSRIMETDGYVEKQPSPAPYFQRGRNSSGSAENGRNALNLRRARPCRDGSDGVGQRLTHAGERQYGGDGRGDRARPVQEANAGASVVGPPEFAGEQAETVDVKRAQPVAVGAAVEHDPGAVGGNVRDQTGHRFDPAQEAAPEKDMLTPVDRTSTRLK